MRTLLLLSLVGLILKGGGCSSIGGETVQGSGDRGTRTESAAGIRHVELGAPGTLVVEVGREAPLQIEGDDNLVARLLVERNGDRLKIHAPRNTSFRPNLPLRLRIGVASLEGVHVAGEGRIEADGVEADALEVGIAGSGDIVLGNVRASSVDVSIAGSGNASVSGSAESVSVDIAGSGNAQVGALAARAATVDIAGSGDVEVRASERLNVDIAGSGNVRYHGTPEITQSIGGSGEIERVGD